MLQLINQTPFAAQLDVIRDETGRDAVLVVAKASFSLDGTPRLHPEQAPIVSQNQFHGEPEQSSLKYAAENHLPQPGLSCVLIGNAWAPQAKPHQQLVVHVQVGALQQALAVYGDRHWEWSGHSEPEPFITMPLCFENAFGGQHHFNPDLPPGPNSMQVHPYNPVGKGFRGKRSTSEMIGQPLPNIEDPKHLIELPKDQPLPIGVGYVSPTWEPRLSYVGTYDEQWQKYRAPVLPADFDRRHFMSGSPGLSALNQYFLGGEPISITHTHPERPLIQSMVPECVLSAVIDFSGDQHALPLRMETLILEPEQNRQQLVMRALFPCERKVGKLKSVRIRLGV
ncbi:DUF2169 family type VI secretion system accessory protein [Hahella ganghwensis]|uniref:DUF2169 family type VI secretion system accessory protein n=1 Tax=Hahella ganghwensis TaxID=286420 RepID=UPI00037BC3BE|nr:DUF2169 domain-containing protein [Hahella ganghwensis]